MEIIENNAEKVWKKALSYILNRGQDFIDKEERVCREVLNLVLVVKDPSASISKPIEILNSFKKWVYPPFEELSKFMLSRKEIPGYYYSYGARVFNFNSLNQIDEYIIPLLKKDRTSRRATLVFYDPLKDSYLHKKETPGMIVADFKIRNDKLHVTVLIRSNDLFFGWPANLYHINVLQNYVGKKLNVGIGSITTFSISAHVFEDQFEDIKKIIET